MLPSAMQCGSTEIHLFDAVSDHSEPRLGFPVVATKMMMVSAIQPVQYGVDSPLVAHVAWPKNRLLLSRTLSVGTGGSVLASFPDSGIRTLQFLFTNT